MLVCGRNTVIAVQMLTDWKRKKKNIKYFADDFLLVEKRIKVAYSDFRTDVHFVSGSKDLHAC